MHNDKSTVFLVTGATGAIGKAIARQLAETENARVVLVCRDPDKAERTVTDIIRQTGNPSIRSELADLSRPADIRSLASRWTGPLHVLINNAACAPRERQETPEGIEIQFATNVLGYFWMTQAFSDILHSSAPAQIINIASYWAGGLDINDLEFTRRRYDNDSAYRQSKQIDRMLSCAFAERLAPYQIAVNACHPGDVHSTLSHNLGFCGHETPDQAALTPVWLATRPNARRSSGRYYEHKQDVECIFCRDRQAVADVYHKCNNYTARSPATD